MFFSFLMYVLFIGLLCFITFVINHLVYDIRIDKLLNIRICELRCSYARKTLRLQNLTARKSVLNDLLTNLYTERDSSGNKIEKYESRLKKVKKEIDKVTLDLETINLKLSDLNKYTKKN